MTRTSFRFGGKQHVIFSKVEEKMGGVNYMIFKDISRWEEVCKLPIL
jgi:hypothetical protein